MCGKLYQRMEKPGAVAIDPRASFSPSSYVLGIISLRVPTRPQSVAVYSFPANPITIVVSRPFKVINVSSAAHCPRSPKRASETFALKEHPGHHSLLARRSPGARPRAVLPAPKSKGHSAHCPLPPNCPPSHPFRLSLPPKASTTRLPVRPPPFFLVGLRLGLGLGLGSSLAVALLPSHPLPLYQTCTTCYCTFWTSQSNFKKAPPPVHSASLADTSLITHTLPEQHNAGTYSVRLNQRRRVSDPLQSQRNKGYTYRNSPSPSHSAPPLSPCCLLSAQPRLDPCYISLTRPGPDVFLHLIPRLLGRSYTPLSQTDRGRLGNDCSFTLRAASTIQQASSGNHQ